MKKLLLILISLSLFTACENEPLDNGFTDFNNNQNNGNNNGNNGNNGNNSNSDDLTLSVYELDIDLSLSFFGFPINTITNSDINISNDIIVSSSIELSTNNSPFVTENQTITRNANGQVISDISVNESGQNTNEYFVTYSGNNISQIEYNYYDYEDPSYNENHVYNYAYNGNVITRTEVGSSITVEFTLNNNDQLIRKEAFENGASILAEDVTYNSEGNIISSVSSGESNNSATYAYDNFENPLKVVYDESYLLNFLADDYSDEIGGLIAQFHSTKNWNSVTVDGTTFNFDLQYNSANRIQSREISYNYGPEFSISINENFNYLN